MKQDLHTNYWVCLRAGGNKFFEEFLIFMFKYQIITMKVLQINTRYYNGGFTRRITYYKTLLNFGKCQSVHFAAQIASFTLTMMQYNILCTVKRFEAYETIGGLFTEVTNDTLELSVTDKIWAIILDFVLEAAERYSIDATELLADFIESNPVAHTLRNMYIYKQAS